jgi:hypothetical protein
LEKPSKLYSIWQNDEEWALDDQWPNTSNISTKKTKLIVGRRILNEYKSRGQQTHRTNDNYAILT